MPVEQFISFESFASLTPDNKRKFIQDHLTSQYINQSPNGDVYLEKLTMDMTKWPSLAPKTKLAVMQFICSTPDFDVSGGYQRCFSRGFFAAYAMNSVMQEVFTSQDEALIGDCLFSLAANQDLTTAVPDRVELLDTNTADTLKTILCSSFLILHANLSALAVAAISLNTKFIIMLLELRQDLNFTPTDFQRSLKDAFSIMAVEEGKLEPIKTWLVENRKSAIEDNLLNEVCSVLGCDPQEQGSKKMRSAPTPGQF